VFLDVDSNPVTEYLCSTLDMIHTAEHWLKKLSSKFNRSQNSDDVADVGDDDDDDDCCVVGRDSNP
jgi:hypothetical protein